MEKIDARKLKDGELLERRRQVIRLHKRGGSIAQIAQVSELSGPAVRKIIRLYETDGLAYSLAGTAPSLSALTCAAQNSIFRIICYPIHFRGKHHPEIINR